MAALLGREDAWVDSEVAAYQQAVAASRAAVDTMLRSASR
jgi:hypothetical protein